VKIMAKEKAVVDLKYPIPGVNGDDPISQLTFGRMKAKHLKAMPDSMMKEAAEGEEVRVTAVEMIPVIAALSGLTKEQADEIDLEDLTAISEVIVDFFDQYQETGSESSGA
jgi:hypothetical protein